MEVLITNGVKITVETFYHTDYSVPTDNKIFFAYRISIQNLNEYQVQLLSRYWMIEDSDGLRREVKGDGVVGEQPILDHDQVHTYISGCPLRTGIGKMWGHFNFIRTNDAAPFKVDVPEFKMVAPFKLN